MANFYASYPFVGGGGGTGTVTSVGLTMPAIFSVAGSPVTTAGTIAVTLATEAANTVFAGPTSGGAVAPGFRAIVAADLPTGNLTDAGTDGIVVTGGTGAVIGSGTSIAQHVADSTHNGYLSSSDWSTFNGKQAALTIGNLTDVGTDGITVTNGTGAVIGSGTSIAQHVADATHNGYLSSGDWSTFNGKQASGNYITALTGDVTASGPGSVSAALVATTNGTLTTLSALTTAGSLASVGTITSGTWSATAVAVNKGGTGVTSVTTAPAATAFAGWDANKNLSANNLLEGYATTATTAGTTTLVVGSAELQFFTGSSTQTVVLPATSTLVTGFSYTITNLSSGAVTVQSSGGNAIQVMAANTELILTCISTSGTGTASWAWVYSPTQSAVLSVAQGGTGQASLTAHDLLIGNGTSAVTLLAPGTSGLPLVSQGASSDPTYATLGISGGGTGQTTKTPAFDALSPTTTKGDAIISNGTNNVREAIGSNGQVLIADSTATTGRSWNSSASLRNLCINSGPDVWQLGTSTVCGPAASTFVCDQWYLKTAGASPFAVTGSQQTGTFGTFALKAIVSAASNGSGNAFEMTTALENADMIQIYNTTASFSCQIKAFGNVTQVGLQFLTATSETKPTTAVGSETLVTVNTGGYTLCAINGQATGTGATTSGVIGVRIRPTVVSSGNIWDLNNGFQMEQATINKGPVAIQYSRAGATYADEVLLCQRYYYKTFPLATAPAQNTGSTVNALEGVGPGANTSFSVFWQFPITMRTTPTITTYNPSATNANWTTNTTTPTAVVGSVGTNGASIRGTSSVTVNNSYNIHATADARF